MLAPAPRTRELVRWFLKRTYAKERDRQIAGASYIVLHLLVSSLDEFNHLLASWQEAGADACVTERTGETSWDCELRFPRLTWWRESPTKRRVLR